jgi:hypothetical protein
VRVPWTNAGYHAELKRWLLWREGAVVSALDTFSKHLTVALPAPPAALVRPALRPEGEECEVLALAAGRRELQLVRFSASAGALVWSAALPAEAKTVVAGLGRAEKGNVRHVAFATETPGGIAIYHSRYTRDGKLEAFESKRFEPAHAPGARFVPPLLLPGVVPALHVDGADRASASFMAVDGDHSVLLEARFGADSGEGMNATTVEAVPQAGTLLYADAQDGSIARRDAVLRLPTGELMRVENGALKRLSAQGQVTAPMLLVPGRGVSYLLYADPQRGTYLEPLF